MWICHSHYCFVPQPTPPHIESRKSHKTRRPPATALATTHLDMVYTTYMVIWGMVYYCFNHITTLWLYHIPPNIAIHGSKHICPTSKDWEKVRFLIRTGILWARGSLCKCILLFLKLRVLKVPLVVFAHMDCRNAIWVLWVDRSNNAVDRHGAWRSFYITYSIHII